MFWRSNEMVYYRLTTDAVDTGDEGDAAGRGGVDSVCHGELQNRIRCEIARRRLEFDFNVYLQRMVPTS